MALAQSKVTAQGQISVPADVRKKLGIVPGSILEWVEDGDQIVIRRVGKYTFEDIHREIFAGKPVIKKSDEELKEGLRDYIRKKHARR